MTKIFTLSFCLFFFSSLFSQVTKKSNLLGGEFYYGKTEVSQNPQEQEIETVMLGVSYGRAIKDNTVIGVHLNFTPLSRYSFTVGSSTARVETISFGISPYFRKYKTLGKGFYLFGELNAQFAWGSTERDFSPPALDSKQTSWSGGVALAPGITYQVLKNMHLQVTVPDIVRIQYGKTKDVSDDPLIEDQTSKGFEFSTRLRNLTQLGTLAVGFYFIF